MKLSAAKAPIRRVADRVYLLVERYDRQRRQPDGSLQRLHQEDFCQALGVAPEYKCQNEGGPDLAQCFHLLRKATRPSAPPRPSRLARAEQLAATERNAAPSPRPVARIAPGIISLFPGPSGSLALRPVPVRSR